MKILGAAVSSGTLFYGALDTASDTQGISHIAAAPQRLVPAVGLTGAQRLADTYQRVVQDVRVLEPDAVIVVATRRHANWRYRDAVERVSLISVLMLACVEQGITCEEWTTERIGKLVGVSASKLALYECKEVGFNQTPTYWKVGRGPAFAAAMAYAAESGENN